MSTSAGDGTLTTGDPSPGSSEPLPCTRIMNLLGGKDPTFKPVTKDIVKEARSSYLKAVMKDVGGMSQDEIDGRFKNLDDMLFFIGLLARIKRLVLLWNALQFSLHSDEPEKHKPTEGDGTDVFITVQAKVSIPDDMWQGEQSDWATHSPGFQILRDCARMLSGVSFYDLTDIAAELTKQHVRWQVDPASEKYLTVDSSQPPFSDQFYLESPMQTAGDHQATSSLNLKLLTEKHHTPDGPASKGEAYVTATLATWKDLTAATLYPFVKGTSGNRKVLEEVVNRLLEGILAHNQTMSVYVTYCQPNRRLRFEIIESSQGSVDVGAIGTSITVRGTTLTRWTGELHETVDGSFEGDVFVQKRIWSRGSGSIFGTSGSANGGWSGDQKFFGRAALSDVENPDTQTSGEPIMALQIVPLIDQPAHLYNEGQDPPYEYEHTDGFFSPLVAVVGELGSLTKSLPCSSDYVAGVKTTTERPPPVPVQIRVESITSTEVITTTTTWLLPAQ